MSLRIVNWNLEWAAPEGPKGKSLRERINAETPEVVCLTEASLDFLTPGHVVASEPDYGYPITASRRKVQLWSRRPWSNVETIGDQRLPPGRFVRATTETSLGPVTFVGVCIPWKDAHVLTGRKDRQQWEDHVAYLEGLSEVLAAAGDRGVVLLGDFNQTVPCTHAPDEVFNKLKEVLKGLTVATSGEKQANMRQMIDHVCHLPDLACDGGRILDKRDEKLGELTDHHGWSGVISSAG